MAKWNIPASDGNVLRPVDLKVQVAAIGLGFLALPRVGMKPIPKYKDV